MWASSTSHSRSTPSDPETGRHVSHALPEMILFVAKRGHSPLVQPFKLKLDFQKGWLWKKEKKVLTTKNKKSSTLHQLVLMPPAFYSSIAFTGRFLVKSPLAVDWMPELIAFPIELGSESPETNMDQKRNHKFKVCGAYWVMLSTYIVTLIQAILTSSYFDKIAWISAILSNNWQAPQPKTKC